MFNSLKKSRFLHWVLSLFRSGKKNATSNHDANLRLWEQTQGKNTYIHSQRLTPVASMRYGRCSASASGCGAVAIFNAMSALGLAASLPDILFELEKSGQLWYGHLGTSPRAVAAYLRNQGLNVITEKRQEHFDELLQNSDAAILYYWNKPKLSQGSHYIMLKKPSNAQTPAEISAYNYSSPHHPDRFASVETFLQGKGPAVVLIGVKNI